MTFRHGALTPVDVVKTRIQLEPALGKLGMVGTARSIVASEGVKGLLTGFGPTAVGYLVQVSEPKGAAERRVRLKRPSPLGDFSPRRPAL